MTVWIHKYAAEPVVKHPGHGDQAVHGKKGGGGGAASEAGESGSAGTLDRKPNATGTKVKVTGSVTGKGRTGVVVDSNASGTFHTVQFANGRSASYHGSDLTAQD